MNRIILIGNGFDLAHGLPTRYEDFINWYWDQWVTNLMTCYNNVMYDCLCSFSIKGGEGTWHSLLLNNGFTFDRPKGKDFVESILSNKESFEVKFSPLLKRIQESLYEKNWVDIENEYYRLLTESISNKSTTTYIPNEINAQLQYLLNLLTQYLGEINRAPIRCNDSIIRFISEPIEFENIAVGSNQYFYDHCNYWANQDRYFLYKHLGAYDVPVEQAVSIRAEVDDFLQKSTAQCPDGGLIVTDISKMPLQLRCPNNTMLLSFNFTGVTDWYSQLCRCYANHIHGDLQEPRNMIFGYGDELDDNYREFLKQENNEYLKNIKSIRYLESSNYRGMLQFIESAPYQVYIMGHSCGNSDRTLLNTLFEHKNCVSIKPYYYQKEDGTDNYLEIVQNICRNFTDMKLMRDRVVNKTFCEPLPQSKTNEQI
ncbi:AbiH family protein [Parabacteroides sp. ZJ-118]|uniref:AbiH family protein n=1 Tax=Parabacteroides sp. ZJ-118 TaxID=2709398 RepID=UPI0013EA4584|nr:AbiH family protein [Parabacteroides sp. ZJ-118]